MRLSQAALMMTSAETEHGKLSKAVAALVKASNAQPQGFGHICFSVPDLDVAIQWFDDNKVVYVKRPEQGKMKDVAFIKDPDGYWIEIVEPSRLKQLGS